MTLGTPEQLTSRFFYSNREETSPVAEENVSAQATLNTTNKKYLNHAPLCIIFHHCTGKYMVRCLL